MHDSCGGATVHVGPVKDHRVLPTVLALPLLLAACLLVVGASAARGTEWQPISYLPLDGSTQDVVTGGHLSFTRAGIAYNRDGSEVGADVMRTELFAADTGWDWDWLDPVDDIDPRATDGCLIYGIWAKYIYTSPDGEYWSLANEFFDHIRGVFVTRAGSVLVSVGLENCAVLFRADQGCVDPVQVLDFDEGVGVWFNYAESDNYIFLSEYGPHKHPPNPRRIYRSADDGQTWDLVYDPEYGDTHCHKLLWDCYGSRIIQATGDGFGKRLFVGSSDDGENWQIERQLLYQPTSGFARPEAVYWGLDGQYPGGVVRKVRGTNCWEMVLDVGVDYPIPRDDQFFGNVFDMTEVDGLLYVPVSDTSVGQPPALYTSADGQTWALSRRFSVGDWGIREFIGQCDGWLLARYIAGTNDAKLLRIRPPAAHHQICGTRFESSVENLLDSLDSSSAEGAAVGWQGFNGASVALDTQMAWHGSQSVRVTCEGPDEGGVVSPSVYVGDLQPGTTVSAIVHVRGAPQTMVLGIVDGNGSRLGYTCFYEMSERWCQASYSLLLPDNVSELAVRLNQSGLYPGLDFRVDGVMLSAGPSSDTWQVGGQSRQADQCSYDFQFPAEWTDVFLWAPDPGTDGFLSSAVTLKVYEASDGSLLHVMYYPIVDIIYLVDFDDVLSIVGTPRLKLAKNAVLRVGVVQSATSRTVMVEIAEDPYVASVAVAPLDIVRIHLGSDPDGKRGCGGLQARHKLFDQVADVAKFEELVRDYPESQFVDKAKRYAEVAHKRAARTN